MKKDEAMNNLKLYMLHKGYSQSSLARKMGVSRSIISKWIKEEEECPLRRKLQMARLLEVDSRLLFPEEHREKVKNRDRKKKRTKLVERLG